METSSEIAEIVFNDKDENDILIFGEKWCGNNHSWAKRINEKYVKAIESVRKESIYPELEMCQKHNILGAKGTSCVACEIEKRCAELEAKIEIYRKDLNRISRVSEYEAFVYKESEDGKPIHVWKHQFLALQSLASTDFLAKFTKAEEGK